jgi:hypothetical protein
MDFDFFDNPQAIRNAGIEILSKELGPVGMAQFMRQFDTGHGDYTAERKQWFNHYTAEKIIDEIEAQKRPKKVSNQDDEPHLFLI